MFVNLFVCRINLLRDVVNFLVSLFVGGVSRCSFRLFVLVAWWMFGPVAFSNRLFNLGLLLFLLI